MVQSENPSKWNYSPFGAKNGFLEENIRTVIGCPNQYKTSHFLQVEIQSYISRKEIMKATPVFQAKFHACKNQIWWSFTTKLAVFCPEKEPLIKSQPIYGRAGTWTHDDGSPSWWVISCMGTLFLPLTNSRSSEFPFPTYIMHLEIVSA